MSTMSKLGLHILSGYAGNLGKPRIVKLVDASAATDAAVRDVTGIALTATESSEYVVNVELNVGLNGSATVNPFVNCFVILIWQTYTTPPTITAL